MAGLAFLSGGGRIIHGRTPSRALPLDSSGVLGDEKWRRENIRKKYQEDTLFHTPCTLLKAGSADSMVSSGEVRETEEMVLFANGTLACVLAASVASAATLEVPRDS